MKYIGRKVSYVKNPFAKNSFYALGLSAAALALAVFAMYLSVSSAGQGGLNTGALGFSSIVALLSGGWYSFLSFLEKERNYILARISVCICVGLGIVWAVIIITGIFR